MNPQSPQSRPDPHSAVLAQIELLIAQVTRLAQLPHPHGILDRSGYLILDQLVLHGPAPVTTLARWLHVDGSTMTRQVTLLEQAGRVHRTHDPFDGRTIMVEPTDQGISDLEVHRTLRANYFREILSEWSILDKSLLAEQLERLVRDLER